MFKESQKKKKHTTCYGGKVAWAASLWLGGTCAQPRIHISYPLEKMSGSSHCLCPAAPQRELS